VGNKLLQMERPLEAIQPLKQVLQDKNTEPLFLVRTCFLLGDAYEKLGKKNWKYYYRKGLQFLEQKQDKTRDEIYTIASTLKRLNRDNEAVPLFEQLITGDKAGNLWDGCYFHLGEILYRRNRLKEAETMFRETLTLNPAHGKAREYLEILSPGESHA
jgi:tetratricopeptide (TPR) repeat protein